MIEVARIDEGFEDFVELGRIRRIVKGIDPYACIYENNGKKYAAFSSGLTVGIDKFRGIKSDTVRGWLLALYMISRR